MKLRLRVDIPYSSGPTPTRLHVMVMPFSEYEKLQKILHLFIEKEKTLVNQMEAADKSEADKLWNESVIWFQAAKIVNNEITSDSSAQSRVMMPYIVGRDPETNEVMVGDRRTHGFFLRGPAMEEASIRNLVQAANERVHQSTRTIADDIATQIEADGCGRQD